jgi:hypothetical protein
MQKKKAKIIISQWANLRDLATGEIHLLYFPSLLPQLDIRYEQVLTPLQHGYKSRHKMVTKHHNQVITTWTQLLCGTETLQQYNQKTGVLSPHRVVRPAQSQVTSCDIHRQTSDCGKFLSQCIVQFCLWVCVLCLQQIIRQLGLKMLLSIHRKRMGLVMVF